MTKLSRAMACHTIQVRFPVAVYLMHGDKLIITDAEQEIASIRQLVDRNYALTACECIIQTHKETVC